MMQNLFYGSAVGNSYVMNWFRNINFAVCSKQGLKANADANVIDLVIKKIYEKIRA